MKKQLYCTKQQLSQINNPAFTEEQIQELRKRTPESEIQHKEDENGRKYKTVSGAYMKKKMNLIFGWNYDFKIIDREYFERSKEVVVQGRLTIRINAMQKHPNGQTYITKRKVIRDQFGKHYLETKTTTSGNVSTTVKVNIGNGFKSAATDAFKKCASEIGLCWDIYTNEAHEGEPEAAKMNHQDKKIFERLEHFFSMCNDSEEVTETFETFEIQTGKENVTEDIKILFNKHMKRTQLTSSET